MWLPCRIIDILMMEDCRNKPQGQLARFTVAATVARGILRRRPSSACPGNSRVR